MNHVLVHEMTTKKTEQRVCVVTTERRKCNSCVITMATGSHCWPQCQQFWWIAECCWPIVEEYQFVDRLNSVNLWFLQSNKVQTCSKWTYYSLNVSLLKTLWALFSPFLFFDSVWNECSALFWRWLWSWAERELYWKNWICQKSCMFCVCILKAGFCVFRFETKGDIFQETSIFYNRKQPLFHLLSFSPRAFNFFACN